MKFLKPALSILLALFITISIPVSAGATVEAPDPDPRPWDSYVSSSGKLRDSATEAESAILIDANTGQVLYEKSADTKRYPASITKIMTCLLTLEHCELTDIVTIPHLEALEEGASKMGLQYGDWISVEELLYGLMLKSANDAGVALATYISGSVEEFATLMNEKCEELGMTNTHFVNPHGLHDNDHYTTARDMATLTMEAMKYPEFVKIVSTAYHTISDTSGDFGVTEWENHNRLIQPNDAYAYEFATGVKTGFTTPAQNTLVASAKKDDFEVIAVMLKDNQLGCWKDAITMFEYAYKYYDTINLKELLAEKPIYVDVENAANGDESLELMMVAESKSFYTDTTQAIDELRANPDRFQMETQYDIPLVAPITKDTQVGTATFSLDGQVRMTCKLYAADNVEAIPMNTPEPNNALVTPVPDASAPPEQSLIDSMKYAIYILGGLIVLLILITIIIFINRRTKYHNYSVSAKTKKHSPRYMTDMNKKRRH